MLGNAVDYVDMPFSGMAVNTNWAARQQGYGRKAHASSTTGAWLGSTRRSNRDEAIRILMKVSSLKKEEIDAPMTS